MIWKPLALVVIALGAFLMYLAPSHAMGQCGNRADFLKALDEKYNESVKSLAVAGQVNLVEVFTSKAGTWTILVTTPDGISCMIAAGNSWEDLPPKLEGKDT